MNRFTPAVRRYLYRIAAAGCYLAATLGLLSGDTLTALLALVGAILNLADLNVTEGADE